MKSYNIDLYTPNKTKVNPTYIFSKLYAVKRTKLCKHHVIMTTIRKNRKAIVPSVCLLFCLLLTQQKKKLSVA